MLVGGLEADSLDSNPCPAICYLCTQAHPLANFLYLTTLRGDMELVIIVPNSNLV